MYDFSEYTDRFIEDICRPCSQTPVMLGSASFTVVTQHVGSQLARYFIQNHPSTMCKDDIHKIPYPEDA